ncbi:D-alanyl-D-alanine carboxypeptidase/D-alanyl-D-alanine endopeptidase [Rhodothermus profundi]|uniref:D-alanyl-D-alanine carboxypeptidase / D-alanyl-D-alanine-endopeptidase (Penicillin-binding protein 4) n=1 Tax=Rhodothermus profundi TaxID=633813 RepID=A0A1M6PEA1_9BACT|nr:D-alanyl-D-alanine carboxypeptidase/D-alanyl-D-alanine-endopeptidase [Rhodothermus profundi]SHK06212.1 D-alanyl-D-alanine carboxypeptidase / D-alanyl-D-alanine-endopeptidase (penicillin-binding protein 4) [Rhodothermus profundi]
MRPKFGILLLLLWSLPGRPVTSLAQPAQHLQATLNQLLDAPAYASAFWGALVLDLRDSTVLYARHARQNFTPASVTKLFITAAALEQLGPDFRYVTRLLADGPIVDGVLQGNLIVRGSGDPAIGGRFTDGDRTATFRAWADSLRRKGIQRIAGDLIGDDDYFDDTPLGTGWSWDDLTYWYAAEISALSFNDNCVDVTIEAGRAGEPGRISWEPPTTYVSLINQTYTIPADQPLKEGYRRLPGTNTIVLFSRVPEGRRDTESLTVSNPTRFFVHVLREVLLAEGIAVEGQPVDVDALSIKPDYTSSRLWTVATYTSPPLSEIVRVINRRSQNLYAEMLLRTLGAERPVADTTLVPGSAEMGLAAAARTWLRAGIDTSRIQFVDGSGLSAQNLVTPEATVRLLAYMASHPDLAVRQTFYTSLPTGGEPETTLQDRQLSDRVRAKTGTLSNTSALAGYVRTPDGRLLAFALFCNHYTLPTRQVRRTIDAFVEQLARYRK